MPRYRVEIDRVACQGFGACEETCSSWYHVSETDNKTTLKGGKRVSDALEVLEVPGELGCIRDGAEACPYNAIHILDLERNIKLI